MPLVGARNGREFIDKVRVDLLYAVRRHLHRPSGVQFTVGEDGNLAQLVPKPVSELIGRINDRVGVGLELGEDLASSKADATHCRARFDGDASRDENCSLPSECLVPLGGPFESLRTTSKAFKSRRRS